MAWVTPKTWSAEPLTSSDMNTHIRDNLNALKYPPSDSYRCDEVADYSTSSVTFVDVDATNLALTIVTTGGDVMIGLVGSSVFNATNSAFVYFDVHESVGAARLGGDDGMLGLEFNQSGGITRLNGSFVWLATGLVAGTHTFKLQWKVSAGTGGLYAGAGTAGLDVHPQFWVREVS